MSCRVLQLPACLQSKIQVPDAQTPPLRTHCSAQLPSLTRGGGEPASGAPPLPEPPAPAPAPPGSETPGPEPPPPPLPPLLPGGGSAGVCTPPDAPALPVPGGGSVTVLGPRPPVPPSPGGRGLSGLGSCEGSKNSSFVGAQAPKPTRSGRATRASSARGLAAIGPHDRRPEPWCGRVPLWNETFTLPQFAPAATPPSHLRTVIWLRFLARARAGGCCTGCAWVAAGVAAASGVRMLREIARAGVGQELALFSAARAPRCFPLASWAPWTQGARASAAYGGTPPRQSAPRAITATLNCTHTPDRPSRRRRRLSPACSASPATAARSPPCPRRLGRGACRAQPSSARAGAHALCHAGLLRARG